MADDPVEVEQGSPFKQDDSPAPKQRKPGLFSPRAPKPRKEKGPSARAPKAKVNMSDTLGLVWGTAGTAIAMRGDPPVGMVMQIQAPYAGAQLNKAIQSSDLAYRFLAPIFGRGKVAEELGSVFAPPIMVAIMERRPETRPVLMPMLRSMLRPALRQVARDMAKEREALSRLSGEEAESDAELDELLATIFGGMTDREAAPSEEWPGGEGEPPQEPSPPGPQPTGQTIPFPVG